MWFIGVEVEQEMSAPPPKKNPGSAPVKLVSAEEFNCTVCLLYHYYNKFNPNSSITESD